MTNEELFELFDHEETVKHEYGPHFQVLRCIIPSDESEVSENELSGELFLPAGFSEIKLNEYILSAWQAHFMLDSAHVTERQFGERMYYHLIRHTPFNICIRDVVELTLNGQNNEIVVQSLFKNPDELNAKIHFGKYVVSNAIQFVLNDKGYKQTSFFDKTRTTEEFIKTLKVGCTEILDRDLRIDDYNSSILSYMRRYGFQTFNIYELNLNSKNVFAKIGIK